MLLQQKIMRMFTISSKERREAKKGMTGNRSTAHITGKVVADKCIAIFRDNPELCEFLGWEWSAERGVPVQKLNGRDVHYGDFADQFPVRRTRHSRELLVPICTIRPRKRYRTNIQHAVLDRE